MDLGKTGWKPLPTEVWRRKMQSSQQSGLLLYKSNAVTVWFEASPLIDPSSFEGEVNETRTEALRLSTGENRYALEAAR
jgi:hypothetical protein